VELFGAFWDTCGKPKILLSFHRGSKMTCWIRNPHLKIHNSIFVNLNNGIIKEVWVFKVSICTGGGDSTECECGDDDN
jgi:hypothetical protein